MPPIQTRVKWQPHLFRGQIAGRVDLCSKSAWPRAQPRTVVLRQGHQCSVPPGQLKRRRAAADGLLFASSVIAKLFGRDAEHDVVASAACDGQFDTIRAERRP